jgi:hypothetical protein
MEIPCRHPLPPDIGRVVETKALLDAIFRATEKKPPLHWQMEAMLQLVLNHRNMPVFLKAPCGSGKTAVITVVSHFVAQTRHKATLVCVPTIALGIGHIMKTRAGGGKAWLVKTPDSPVLESDEQTLYLRPDRAVLTIENHFKEAGAPRALILFCTARNFARWPTKSCAVWLAGMR